MLSQAHTDRADERPTPATSLAFLRCPLTLYRMVMPIGTPFLKEKINN